MTQPQELIITYLKQRNIRGYVPEGEDWVAVGKKLYTANIYGDILDARTRQVVAKADTGHNLCSIGPCMPGSWTDQELKVEIVPARPEHAAACVRISLEAYEQIHEYYKEHLGEELHDAVMADWREQKAAAVEKQQLGDHAFVALVNGTVVGFAAYRVEGDTGVIANNAVDNRYRGNGIGGQLYEKVLSEMKKNGVQFARVLTGGDEGHAPARRAYEKAGFQKNLPSVTYYMDLREGKNRD